MVEPTGKQAGGVCHRDGGHGEGGGAKGGGEVLVRAGGLAFSFIGGAQGIGLHLDAQEGVRGKAGIAAWQGLPEVAAGVGSARRV
jgi:hypothetical protein